MPVPSNTSVPPFQFGAQATRMQPQMGATTGPSVVPNKLMPQQGMGPRPVGAAGHNPFRGATGAPQAGAASPSPLMVQQLTQYLTRALQPFMQQLRMQRQGPMQQMGQRAGQAPQMPMQGNQFNPYA